MMRQTLLYLSHNKGMRRWMETSRLVRGLTGRFVAGTTLEAAMGVCRQLYGEQLLSTIDQLGENVNTDAEAVEFRRSIEGVYRAIAESGLPHTVSIKPTQLGLDLSTDLFRANTDILARMAQHTDKAAALAEGLKIAQEMLAAVRGAVQGVQVSAPFGKFVAAAEVLGLVEEVA